VKTVPTIRSHFTFAQFEEALRKLAYQKAVEALQTMNNRTLVIKAFGKRLDTVETDGILIRFYAAHASYTQYGSRDKYGADTFNFDIEEKLYTDSDHSSKITFATIGKYERVEDGEGGWDYKMAPGKKKQEAERKRIMEFIDELMAGVKTKPRFSLENIQKKS